jgi:Lon protease-like protein
MRTTLQARGGKDGTAGRDGLDPATLRELPIFPLPNAVLLPGGVLPLHVFEPRYREMTRDCLAGSRTMAIALLRPHAGDEIFPICGVGSIRCSEELPDGRYHIVLHGVARVRVDEELPLDRAYRRVRATLVDGARTERPDVLPSGHRQLLALCDRLALALEHGGSELCELVRAQPDAASCADAVAAALVTAPRLRQAFLETLDAADRLDAAIDLVGRIVCQLTPSGQAN